MKTLNITVGNNVVIDIEQTKIQGKHVDTLDVLHGVGYIAYDTQDIKAICHECNINYRDITAVWYQVLDAEIVNAHFSTSNRPYDIYAIFWPLDYYPKLQRAKKSGNSNKGKGHKKIMGNR